MSKAEGSTSSAIAKHDDLLIPVRGDTVAATRYEPAGNTDPLPAMLMYVPYDKDSLIAYGSKAPIVQYLAHNGYQVVIADMVGTGGSSGSISEMFLRREGKEAAAIVEWIADQEWCTGSVGMFGKSYGGITALDAAAQQPDSLEVIVPILTPYKGWRNAYTDEGLFELLTIGIDWLTLMQALDVKPPNRRDSDGRWKDVWQDRLETVRDRTPWLLQFLQHQTKEPYWDDKDIPIDRIETPTLAVGGWRDPYVRDTFEYFEAIDAPKRLLMGPWRHAMPHRGRETAIDFRRLVVDWCDYFLKGEGSDRILDPEVTIWTERNGGGKIDDGYWQGLEEWPTAAAAPASRRFVLTDDGLVGNPIVEERSDLMVAEVPFDQTVGLESTDPYGAQVEPLDTNADDARSRCFETEPLDEPFEFTGSGTLSLRLTSSIEDPTLSARLVDVSPDGRATLVTHGTVRLSYLDDLAAPEPLVPGEEYEVEVPLLPKSHVFEPGHRIRLSIGAAFFPEYMPTGEHGSFEIRSAPGERSMLELPGTTLDGEPSAPIEFDAPDEAIPPASQTYSSDASWETARERTADRAIVRKSNSRTAELPASTLEIDANSTAVVDADDPTSIEATSEMTMVTEFDGDDRNEKEVVRIDASSRIRHGAATVSTQVFVDDETVFDEEWTGEW